MLGTTIKSSAVKDPRLQLVGLRFSSDIVSRDKIGECVSAQFNPTREVLKGEVDTTLRSLFGHLFRAFNRVLNPI